MSTTQKLQARDLKTGDFLTASGATILSAIAGTAVTQVEVKYSNGKESVRMWNSRTEMKIERVA